MNFLMAAQRIRDTVDMQTILSLYGYHADRNGFMRCPFHGERAGSLKVYTDGRGWHCYGCGRGGSVIDFVMEHENCDFKTAVIAIDKAVGLNLVNPHENPLEVSAQQRLQEWLDAIVREFNEICDLLMANIEAEQFENYRRVFKLELRQANDFASITCKDWETILSFKDDDEYNDYRKEKIRKFKEGVAEWRRKYRRAMT